MQEIRCQKCNKIIAKAYVMRLISEHPASLTECGVKYIEIKCPGNYRDENGKNVQCKTLNKIVI
jgi:phage FluMu protein Com